MVLFVRTYQKREPDDDKVEAVPVRFPEPISLCVPQRKQEVCTCIYMFIDTQYAS